MAFDRLEACCRPDNRSEEQIELQQFSTPPRIAWLAARAAAIGKDELMLEPSAGTGMLAVWGHAAGARLALNEISPLRRECLANLFPGAALSGHDGELIDELLDPALAPSLVLMNPPYSHGIERGHDGRTGTRHLRSAWNGWHRRAPGRGDARVVRYASLLAGFGAPISLRLNVAIERGFARHGTSITTRLLVFDKQASEADPVLARTNDFAQICELVEACRRAGLRPARPRLTPLCGSTLGLTACQA